MKKIISSFLASFFLASIAIAVPENTYLSPLQIPFVLVNNPGNKEDTSYGGRGLGAVKKKF